MKMITMISSMLVLATSAMPLLSMQKLPWQKSSKEKNLTVTEQDIPYDTTFHHTSSIPTTDNPLHSNHTKQKQDDSTTSASNPQPKMNNQFQENPMNKK